MIDKIIDWFLAIFTVTISVWIVMGSMWLVFYIDEIMQKKLPKYKKWSDESANDL